MAAFEAPPAPLAPPFGIFVNTTMISPAFSILCPESALPSPPSPPQHLYQLLLWTLFFTGVDFAAKPLLRDPAPRWFFIHALANAIVCVFSFGDLLSAAARPLCALASPTLSWVPSYSAGAVHFFHLVVYWRHLRSEDIVHHLVFGVLLSILNFSFAWGRATNFLLFFITGLPGGITYALLVLVKLGKLKALREKGWTAQLNTWVRAPGLVWFVGMVQANLAHGFYFVPTWTMVACIALAFSNGTYYGKQALENYVERRVEKRVSTIVDPTVAAYERKVAANKAPSDEKRV